MARYFHKNEEIDERLYKELLERHRCTPDLNIKQEGVRGLKHDFSKPQMSLLPMKDLEGVVRVLEFGAKKYARGDWQYVENGAFRYLDAGLRHSGELTDATTIEELRILDPESRLPAIDHAICSLIFARHFIFKDFKEEDPDGEVTAVPVQG